MTITITITYNNLTRFNTKPKTSEVIDFSLEATWLRGESVEPREPSLCSCGSRSQVDLHRLMPRSQVETLTSSCSGWSLEVLSSDLVIQKNTFHEVQVLESGESPKLEDTVYS